jgi:hypothetical protein
MDVASVAFGEGMKGSVMQERKTRRFRGDYIVPSGGLSVSEVQT